MPHLSIKPRTRFLYGVAALFLVLSVYLPDSPWTALRIGLERTAARAASAVMPPKGATKMLKVPFHKQEHALSCEVASLRSALHALNIVASEDVLLGALPRDETPKKLVGRGPAFTWGDPDKGFVGNVNGRMPSTGYGVHADPIAEVAGLYATAIRMRSDDAVAIVRAIDAGHPVMVWTVLGRRPYAISWKTPAGKTVRAAMYEHTLVVYGYRGTAKKLEGVYVVDPLTGLRYAAWNDFTWRTGFLDHQALEISP